MTVGYNPIPKSTDALLDVDLRMPAQERSCLSNVADVTKLIPGTPVSESSRDRFALKSFQDFVELPPYRHRVGRPAADVKDFARYLVDFISNQEERSHEIIDEQQISDLLAIPINSDWSSSHSRNDEVGHPSLILSAELPGAIDTAHSEDNAGQIVNSGVVAYILVRGTLRAPIR